ncbi:MAG: DUF2855 family protein [Ardenticatenaceae bacterium]
MTELLIQRSNIREIRFVESEPSFELTPNQLLLKVDHFAFTANNITYAAVGERIGYWRFFPTKEAGWGKVPVWGFADVVESTHPEVAVGERIYGFFPLATHLVVSAKRVTPSGFYDAAPHRQSLNAIYNQYTRTKNTPGFAPQDNHLNALLRPMFTTSFLVDDFLFDNDFFGAQTLILSSASSKTAYGTAFLLHHNRDKRSTYHIVGLTSRHNVPFVEQLGCYDQVLPYDDVHTLPNQQAAVYVDFSGNGKLRKTIHEHYEDQLKYDASVGITDWDKPGSSKGLPGARALMFFAPAQLQKRLKEWGGATYQQRMGNAWLAFLKMAQDWIEVTPRHGQTAVEETYLAMLNGEASPKNGFILSL